jgi:hypothetical protein
MARAGRFAVRVGTVGQDRRFAVQDGAGEAVMGRFAVQGRIARHSAGLRMGRFGVRAWRRSRAQARPKRTANLPRSPAISARSKCTANRPKAGVLPGYPLPSAARETGSAHASGSARQTYRSGHGPTLRLSGSPVRIPCRTATSREGDAPRGCQPHRKPPHAHGWPSQPHREPTRSGAHSAELHLRGLGSLRMVPQ